jgi:DNA invertase Pin-like site-specific DNA recombinase
VAADLRDASRPADGDVDARWQAPRIRAALYARVSHVGEQNPETQLGALRAFALARGWDIAGEYVDRAPAWPLNYRQQWRQLRADCRGRKIDAVVVWKLDRAFRSALDALSTVKWLQRHRVDFVCASQAIDTSSSIGRLLFTVLAAVAEIESEFISERTRAGLARVRDEGKQLGRPKGSTDRQRRRSRRGHSRLALAAGAEDLL